MPAYDEDLWQFECTLQQRLYRLFCPSSMDLLAYHQRHANPERYVVIANHLRECPACQSEIALLDEINLMPLLLIDSFPG
jgi:hypothetical protein